MSGTTLADRFQKAGLATRAFIGVGFLENISAGFDEASLARGATKLRDSATDWLRDQPAEARFLLWLHFFDVHRWQHQTDRASLSALAREDTMQADSLTNYLEDEHGLSRNSFKTEEEGALGSIDAYDSLIRRVDSTAEQIYRQVDRFDGPTLWVVTADHGEGLGSHGYLKHGARIWQEQLRVPLIFHVSNRSPQIAAGRVVPELVRLVDVASTIVQLLGLPTQRSEERVEGRSFTSLLQKTAGTENQRWEAQSFAQRLDLRNLEEHSARYALQADRYKVVLPSDPNAAAQLFDLSADPQERKPRSPGSVPAGPGMVSALRLHARTAERALEQSPPLEDSKHNAELRALGYIE